MNLPPTAQKTRIGTCPHGLPLGACPICNGGGGGGSSKRAESKPSNEMSWDECYAVWQQMLKTKEQAQLKQDLSMQAGLHATLNPQGRLENIAQKIAGFAQKLTDFVQTSKNSTGILQKTLAVIAKIAIPVLNVLKNITTLAQNTINFIREKLADISDKLNAMFGELKNSIEKKISDKLKDFKKKFKSIFGLIETKEIDDEEKKIEEEKRMFELKTVFNSIKENLLTKKEIEDGNGN